MLTWARERSGRTVAQVAAAMGKDAEAVAAWEAGTSGPTYVQLEKLAYEVFKRPIAVFFFPEPPEEPTIEQSFRTLPDTEIAHLAPQTRYRILDARALQLALHELNEGRNPAASLIFRDIEPDLASPAVTAARVREYLGVPVELQRHGWRTITQAAKGWRDAVEEKGVFVFKNTFKQRDVSGFCLHDAEFPIIYLNNSTPETRQIFTIAHELGHVLAGAGGITKIDDRFVRSLAGQARNLEVFCNRFASELLLPAALVPAVTRGAGLDETVVVEIADEFKVSREVVLRRYRDLGAVSRDTYDRMVARWRIQEQDRGAGGGGNYYATQAAYFGQRFLRLAFALYHRGAFKLERLADMLNVRPANVPGLEALVAEGR